MTHAEQIGALFREHAGALTARLTRAFGPANLELVEAVVQEAFIKASQSWDTELPDNPFAWLLRVARNQAIDEIRRQRTFDDKQPELEAWLGDAESPEPEAHFETELTDDQLRMMFVACYPGLPQPSQIALTLRTLGGLTTGEIAAAFLTEEPTIAKRLVRARAQLRETGLEFELPSPDELQARLDAVLAVVYVLFSAGHRAHHGDEPVRIDLCREAVRLVDLLAQHDSTSVPRVHALLALLLLQSSRLVARTDGSGDLLTLLEQDRKQWDEKMIHRGLFHLGQSAQGDQITPYHLQAAIAAVHARSPDPERTPWGEIVGYYDQLLALEPSPVVALNRAIAVGMAEGPDAGLAALDEVANAEKLRRHAPLPAARGHFLARAGRTEDARAAYNAALELAANETERRFLQRAIAALG